MGWKASFVIIHKSSRKADEQLLVDLGYKQLARIADKPFDDVVYPRKNNRVYIGVYDNKIIVCDMGMPMQFFDDGTGIVENKLAQLFPTAEVCVIGLISTVNFWAYALM